MLLNLYTAVLGDSLCISWSADVSWHIAAKAVQYGVDKSYSGFTSFSCSGWLLVL